MTMGEKILNLRKARGWSQEELAEQVGVTRQAVSRWESNSAKPDADKIIAICDLFGVSADYLLRENYAGEVTAVPPSQRQTTALGDAIRAMTLKQWGCWFLMVFGGIVLFILQLLCSVNPSVYVVHIGEAVRVYDGLPGYLKVNDLEWLWLLGFSAVIAGVLILFIIPFHQNKMKKRCSKEGN